jgi:two-component system phosphate regulon sensor histidine kinase PhoR
LTAVRLRADQQLFLSYLLLISVLTVSLSFGADSLLRRHLMGSVADDLRRELALGHALYESLPDSDPDALADRLGALSGRRVTLIAADGTVLGESEPVSRGVAAMENHADREEVREAREGRIGEAVRLSGTVGAAHLYLAARTSRGEILRFSVPLAEIDAALVRVQRGIFAVGAVTLLLAGAFSFGFSQVVTRPLRRIRAAARAMAAGDLSRRLRERRRDELGDVAAALDALADQLQHRLAQLEEERFETQALIDSMSEGVLAFSPSGGLRRANPAARQMFALPERTEGIPPEAVARRPEFLRLVSRALGGEAAAPTELQSDGRSLLATAHPLPDGGAVLVLLDVSELRRLEGVRRDFVANASHELKTPLTAIRGYSETLLDPGLPAELRGRFADIIKANADRLQRIVDDLLDLSRIESGGWRVEPERISIGDVAREAWTAQTDRLGDPGIRFGLQVEEGAEEVFGDAAALHQVFTNLFSNALRYTPAGGSIAVRARPLAALHRISRSRRGAAGARPLPGWTGGRWIQVEVVDSGSGIPAAHLPRIFERFYRADPARSRAEGGTGLGLAIVRHLVEAHGGSIEAESRVGQGTTIRLTLPAPGGRPEE